MYSNNIKYYLFLAIIISGCSVLKSCSQNKLLTIHIIDISASARNNKFIRDVEISCRSISDLSREKDLFIRILVASDISLFEDPEEIKSSKKLRKQCDSIYINPIPEKPGTFLCDSWKRAKTLIETYEVYVPFVVSQIQTDEGDNNKCDNRLESLSKKVSERKGNIIHIGSGNLTNLSKNGYNKRLEKSKELFPETIFIKNTNFTTLISDRMKYLRELEMK